MSGKISNHNEIVDESVKVKDINHESPEVADIDIDLKKKTGVIEEMKLVNGIVKDDFEKSKNNFEKETVTNASKSNIENVTEEVGMKNGFNSSEASKDNQETSSVDKSNKYSDSNGLNTESFDEKDDTHLAEPNKILIPSNSDNKIETPKNDLDLVPHKEDVQLENTVSEPCNNDNSKIDSAISIDKTIPTAETNNDDKQNKAKEKIEINQGKSDKVEDKAKEEDENNDVIIIGSTEGVSKISKESSESSQKQDTRGTMPKPNKPQVGPTPQIKNELPSTSMSSSSSTAPSLGDTSMTAFARLLHDLGVELVRQHVYKDLVEIQVSKDAQNKLNDREKEQLAKLEEFYAKQEIRNAPYNLKEYTVRCKCRVFASESKNVMRLHQEYGRIESGSVHVCCCCKEFKSRWPSHYITHMKSDHEMVGRLRKKMSPYRCSFCSYEAKNQLKIDTHMITCSKRFVLACNLQPLPADTDIPLKRRFIQTISYTSSQNRYSNYLGNNNNNPNNTGYTSIYNQNNQSFQSYFNQSNNRALSDPSNRNLYNNMSGNSSILSQQQQQAVKDGRVVKMEICEICGSNISSRAALLNHLQIMHKVKLNTARGSTEPIMSCDRCPSRFWTYQGLAKHATMVHKSSASSSLLSNSVNTNSQSGMHANVNRVPPVCHICGDSQTFNPLNHMSTRHNITLLDMYQVKQCYICNKALKNGPNFQEHMVLYHRDIFANKDVLHTVLQALSAARHLKREESSQLSIPSNFNKYKKPMTSTPISAQKSGMYGSMGMVGVGGMKSASIKRKSSQTSPTMKPPEKEKKTTEQERIEMEKLYENLAGIGRPILRSMRQRMSSGPATSTTCTSSTSAHTILATTNTSSSIQSSSNSVLKKSESSKSDNPISNNFSNNSNNNNNNNSINNNINSNNRSGMSHFNHSKNNSSSFNNSINNNNNTNNNNTNNNNINNNNNNKQNNVNSTKNDSSYKDGAQDLKTSKLQPPPSSSSAVEPEAKRQKVDESVIINDSN